MTNTNIPRFPYSGSLLRRSEPIIDCGLTPQEIATREAEFLRKWQSATSRVTAELITREVLRKPTEENPQ